MITRKIWKSGHSYVVSLPRDLMRYFELSVGDTVEIITEPDSFIIMPVVSKGKVAKRIAAVKQQEAVK